MMRKETQLDIVWEGEVQGLEQHRVSLAEFGSALNQLLAATRRIASQIAQNALEATESGRLANTAKFIDIELAAVKEGSSGFATVLSFDSPDKQAEMFGNLLEDVGRELMHAIQLESEGTYRNASVRKYLASLPKGLKRQSYSLRDSGQEIMRVDIGTLRLPKAVTKPISLLQVAGKVAGVGFEPGRPEVRIKSENQSLIAIAVDKQIEKAIRGRGEDVFAVAIESESGTRLAALKTRAEREARKGRSGSIFKKWHGAFEALA